MVDSPENREIVDGRVWIALAGINGFLAVALGAVGEHLLTDELGPAAMQLFSKGVDYQLSHALALLGTAALSYYARGRQAFYITSAGWAFTFGILLFSGSLYWLAVNGPGSLGAFAFITPAGAVALLAGWALLSVASMRLLWPFGRGR